MGTARASSLQRVRWVTSPVRPSCAQAYCRAAHAGAVSLFRSLTFQATERPG